MVTLLATGKHTEIVLTRGPGLHTILGMTIDIAIGDCIDKCYRKLREYDEVLLDPSKSEEYIERFNQNTMTEFIPTDYFDFIKDVDNISPGAFLEKLARYGDPSEFEMPITFKSEFNADMSFTGIATSFKSKVCISILTL